MSTTVNRHSGRLEDTWTLDWCSVTLGNWISLYVSCEQPLGPDPALCAGKLSVWHSAIGRQDKISLHKGPYCYTDDWSTCMQSLVQIIVTMFLDIFEVPNNLDQSDGCQKDQITIKSDRIGTRCLFSNAAETEQNSNRLKAKCTHYRLHTTKAQITVNHTQLHNMSQQYTVNLAQRSI